MSPSVTASGYQHVVVSGSPYERGTMHGKQAIEKIRTNIQRYKHSASSTLPNSDICATFIRNVYLPAIEKDFVAGLEEMRGIADGAEVDLSDIILLNARYDLARLQGTSKVGECTSMAYLQDRGAEMDEVYVAQNWDMSSWLYDEDTIIVLESHNPAADNESSPSTIIALTEAGQLARSGMNSCGLGLCANSLWSNEDASLEQPISESKPVLPFTLARRMFLECGNFAAGLKAVCSFPRHVSGNVIVGTREGVAIDVELTPSSYFTLSPQVPLSLPGSSTSTILTHANHFVSPAMQSRPDILDTYTGGSSLFRDRRLLGLVSKDLAIDEPPIVESPRDARTIDSIKRAFADHAGFPRSLCEHEDKGEQKYGAVTGNTMTVASVIYDLQKLEMHICKGNPCCGTWITYRISKERKGNVLGFKL
ncbi:uncharacterized protein PAC_12591 [Phialocephala subalpina]|uniref:Peptidase C45 hydrolase domain-containing protein n=1 Tax=Phialocephala subalpina TaxID=576137 RepID=A0A1L7XCC9_9HELO|nr:uncharacterized protein PAC_12591 [Phialocephala subalpina]